MGRAQPPVPEPDQLSAPRRGLDASPSRHGSRDWHQPRRPAAARAARSATLHQPRPTRLQASARQNDLTRAIQEYGRVIKTISILRYLHNEDHRRRIHHQLNKGESLHALRRQLFFANLGRLHRRRPDDQDLQAQCLTLLTNAVICWNTAYLAAGLDYLETTAKIVPDDATIRRLSPTVYEHINLYGRYNFANLTPPPAGQLRPLRAE